VTWRAVAVVAFVIAASLAVALAVVASLNGADTLSTVALALAVLAFTTQILVFVADAWTTSRLNAETHGLLRELRTRAQGTEKTLSKQVDKLTAHILEGVSGELKSQGEPWDLRARVRQDVQEVLLEINDEEAGVGIDPASSSALQEEGVEPPQATPEEIRIVDMLVSFPDEEEGRATIGMLSELHPLAVATLKDFVRDEWRSRTLGEPVGLHLRPDHPFTDSLVERGLVETFQPDPEGDTWAALTERGRQAGRVMTAPLMSNEIPAWLKEGVDNP